jgi:hypothetical protein
MNPVLLTGSTFFAEVLAHPCDDADVQGASTNVPLRSAVKQPSLLLIATTPCGFGACTVHTMGSAESQAAKTRLCGRSLIAATPLLIQSPLRITRMRVTAAAAAKECITVMVWTGGFFYIEVASNLDSPLRERCYKFYL